MNNTKPEIFPPLRLEDWEETKNTLHLYMQIAGKIKLRLMPYRNHWWNAALYINSRGIGTSPIPYNNITFELNFDFFKHELIITTNEGGIKGIALKDGLCVADLYKQVFDSLSGLGIAVKISPVPYEHESKVPCDEDHDNCAYQKEYVFKFWKILSGIDVIFKEFGGRFLGKCSPVHLFWHSFDLAVTRFSGKRAPEMKGANTVNREAYTHEVISAGFWAGDRSFREAAFYSYTYPLPEGISEETLLPEGRAKWEEVRGSPMAIFRYEDFRKEKNPKVALLDFMESSYMAGARRAGWDIEGLSAQRKKP